MTNNRINGYMLREALKRWDRQRKITSKMFNSCLFTFQGDKKPSAISIMEQFQVADRNYARLQELQQEYNHNVSVTLRNTNNTQETMQLSLAVKLVGGAGRIEKMWSDSIGEKEDRYSRYERQTQRSKDVDYATRTISEGDCMTYANAASQYRSDLVSAIARANTTDYNAASISDAEFNTLFGDITNITTTSSQGVNR